MATLQRLSYITDAVDLLHLGLAYRRLSDLSLPRCRLVMSILAEGPMNVITLERAMFHSGDHNITQSVVSQTVSMLKRHRMIYRVYPIELASHKNHYYALNRKEIARINAALSAFSSLPVNVPGSL